MHSRPLVLHHGADAQAHGALQGRGARRYGLQDRDITIAQALKPLGYATGQFGKNHLGDRDEYLPTRHGFDEFFRSGIARLTELQERLYAQDRWAVLIIFQGMDSAGKHNATSAS